MFQGFAKKRSKKQKHKTQKLTTYTQNISHLIQTIPSPNERDGDWTTRQYARCDWCCHNLQERMTVPLRWNLCDVFVTFWCTFVQTPPMKQQNTVFFYIHTTNWFQSSFKTICVWFWGADCSVIVLSLSSLVFGRLWRGLALCMHRSLNCSLLPSDSILPPMTEAWKKGSTIAFCACWHHWHDRQRSLTPNDIAMLANVS